MSEMPKVSIDSRVKNAISRSAPELPSLVRTFEEGMSKLEKEERARRAYTEIHHTMLGTRYSLQDRPPGDPKAVQMYCDKMLILRVVKFYQACLAIRENFNSWEKYISDPTEEAPFPLDSITKDSELVLGLALLDRCKIICLDPSEPFIRGEEKWLNILIDAEVTLESFKDMVPLWLKLRKPALFNSDLMDRLSDDESSSSKIKRVGYLHDGIWCYSTGGIEDDLHMHVFDILGRRFQTPIRPSKGSTYAFGILELTSSSSFAMALESKDTDLLDYIFKLFPEYPEFIPRIIKDYCLEAISVPYRYKNPPPDNEAIEKVQKMHEEAFGCDLFYKDNESEWTRFYHRGALRQIREHPELFELWKSGTKMQPIYRTMIAPALREKLKITWRL